MRRFIRHRPSPAMVVACVALLVALGGTSYAAIRLPANSVGTRHIKNGAVTSLKIKNNTITGSDVREATLAKVPRAGTADFATDAQLAEEAVSAGTAENAFKLNGMESGAFAPATTVVRYAVVFGPGTVGSHRGVEQANVSHPATGVTCIDGLNPAPREATATLRFGAVAGSEIYVKTAPAGEDLCAGRQVGVLTYDVTVTEPPLALVYTLQDKPFTIAIY